MQDKKIYTVTDTKLDMAYCEGFKRLGNVMYAAAGREDVIILNRFRSYEKGTKWGRFHCKAKLSPSSQLKIYAFALDGEEGQAEELNAFFHNSSAPWKEKRAYFEQEGVHFTGHEDVLLYGLTGEYLWIAIEIESDAKAADDDSLCDMKLDSQGDNFMQAFPEIYQEENGFFHRYMSIFSTVYQGISDEAEGMDKYLDIETMPLPVLMRIAEWFGFEADGDFLDEELLRRLIKNIYSLNRIKGTKQVMKDLIKGVLGDDAFIVERNKLKGYIPADLKDVCQKLYGNAMQDVTIIVKRPADEKLQSQMMYLLKQFKPIRSRIKLIFSEKCGNLDSYCYLDYNASIFRKGYARMDGNNRLNETAVLI